MFFIYTIRWLWLTLTFLMFYDKIILLFAQLNLRYGDTVRENKALRIIGRLFLVIAPFIVYYFVARVCAYITARNAYNEEVADFRNMYSWWTDSDMAQFKEQKLAELSQPLFWSEHITAATWAFAVLCTFTLAGICVVLVILGRFIVLGYVFDEDGEELSPACTNLNCKCVYHGTDIFDTENGEWATQTCKKPSCRCGYHDDEWFDERGYEWTDRPQPPSGNGSSDDTALYATAFTASTVAAATMINNP
jgi:hypothetical protein